VAAGSALTVLSGENGQPVIGAAVASGSGNARTDGTGMASLPAASDRVTVQADGFLARQALLRSAADTRIVLWPVRSGFDEGFTRDMAYSAVVNPTHTLTRPMAPVTLVLAAPVRDAFASTAREAAAAMTDANGGVIPYQVADAAPAGAITFTVDVNPNEPYFLANPGTHAMTEVRFSGNRVLGGRIVFRALEYGQLVGPFLHELGHTFGAGHPSQPGLMNGTIRRNDRSFSPAERLAFSLMAQRRPGNAFPDNDTAVTALAAQRTVVIGD
jgi:hypothetical protein